MASIQFASDVREQSIRSAPNSGNAQIEYFGYAAAGSATSSAVWKIFRMDSSAGPTVVVKQYANGNANYTNIWDNREALTYV